MYAALRPLLFRLDPETAHRLTLQLIRLGAYQPLAAVLRGAYAAPEKPVQAFGLNFRNPVGLAAGYDKDALAFRGLAALGFGHIEVGTVTPRPQPGNPRPRLFRLVEDRALINRLGFPGRGGEFVARQLAPVRRPRLLVVGVNLGKNKETPLEEAAADYLGLVRRFMPLADYLTINVSSPNTVGLRRLQGRDMLESLLNEIAKERRAIGLPEGLRSVPLGLRSVPLGHRDDLGRGGHAPILVKLAPDLSDAELDDALDVILRAGMDGVIATNTTLGREGLRSARREETGGLSGAPLRARSEAVLRRVVKRLDGRLPVVSAGGIMSPQDAKARLEAGAVLVQVYTGLVYAGPGLVKRILQKL
jgi:dihydroorotate dehydrogenase